MKGFKINFYLQKSKVQSIEKEYTKVILSVAWNRQRIRKSLNIPIARKSWDDRKQRAKASASDPIAINNRIDKIRNELTDLYLNTWIETNKEPEKILVVNFIDELIGKKNLNEIKSKEELMFIDYFRMFIEDSENGNRLSGSGRRISISTIKSYKSALNHLTEFGKKTKYDLGFDQIDKNFFSKFSKFLSKKNVSNNSQGKYVKIIKSMMHYCLDKEIHSNTKFIKDLKVQNDPIDMVYLNEEEVKRIEDLSIAMGRLSDTRDCFLVQIYTGLRYSDLRRLKRSNLVEDEIKIRTIKTDSDVRIPIHKRLRELLEKRNYQLPVRSSQKYNDAIKKLCKHAKIDSEVEIVNRSGKDRITSYHYKYDLVSSHTARRTFITLMLKKGLVPETVMKITGHKSRKSFEKYVRVTQSESVDAVREAWEST